MSTSPQLIYAGPMNKMMIRLKAFSLFTLFGSLSITPFYMYQVKKRQRESPEKSYPMKPHLYLLSGMLLGSFISSYLFHRIARKYVLQMFRIPLPASVVLPLEQEIVRLEQMDFFGRLTTTDLPVSDLKAVGDGINTWKSSSSGKTFFLAIPNAIGEPFLNASTADSQINTLLPRAGAISSEGREFLKALDLHLRSKQLIGQYMKK